MKIRKFVLFNRQWVHSIGRQLVKEHEELPEGLKERPTRQQADALVCVDGEVGYDLLLHSGEQTQLYLLFLTKTLHRKGLIELYASSINLSRIKHCV